MKFSAAVVHGFLEGKTEKKMIHLLYTEDMRKVLAYSKQGGLTWNMIRDLLGVDDNSAGRIVTLVHQDRWNSSGIEEGDSIILNDKIATIDYDGKRSFTIYRKNPEHEGEVRSFLTQRGLDRYALL